MLLANLNFDLMNLSGIVEIIIPVCLISFVIVLIAVQFLPKENADRENLN
jgi:hypothetical protein